MSSTLHDYTDVAPLEAREIETLIDGGTTVGWIGPSNRDENVLVSHRHRYEYDDGKQDYFRKYSGYCYGESALNQMKSMGVTRLAIEEVDNDRILEFDLAQYLTSPIHSDSYGSIEARSEDEGRNILVPVDDALYTWTTSEAAILKDH